MLLEADCPARGFNWKSWASALALGLMVCISDIRLPGESDPAGETQSPEMLESVFVSADFFTGDAEDARVAGMPTADFNPPREPMLLPYDRIIHEAAGRYDLDADLIAAVIMAESQFKPGAISKKGAKGLMQLMPDTAEALNLKNVYSPRENIHAGTRHLKWLLSQFDSDLRLALAAYNAGEKSVLTYKGIPPHPETQAYVTRVMEYYRAIKDASITF